MSRHLVAASIAVALGVAVLFLFNPEVSETPFAFVELIVGLLGLYVAGAAIGWIASPRRLRAVLGPLFAAGVVLAACGTVAGQVIGLLLAGIPFLVAAGVCTTRAGRGVTAWLVLASLVASLLVAGNVARLRPAPPSKQLVLVGLDGVEWTIVDRMRAEGALPTYDTLVREGARAGLQTLKPILSPPIWTSIASGTKPDRHGIKDFFVSSPMVRVKRIWDIADENGLVSGVFGYLVTWPPRKSNGFLVPGWLAQGTETYPPSLSFVKQLEMTGKGGMETSPLKLAGLALEALQHGMSVDTAHGLAGFVLARRFGLLEDRDLAFEARRLKLRLTTDVFCHLQRTVAPELAIYYNSAVDTIQHLFFKYYAPEGFEVSAEDVARYGSAIPAIYEESDRTLDRIRRWSLPNADFMVVSDHGQKPASKEGGEWRVIKASVLVDKLGIADEVRATNVGPSVFLRALETPPSDWDVAAKIKDVEVLGEGGGALFDVEERGPGELIVHVNRALDASLGGNRRLRLGTHEIAAKELVDASDRVSGVHTETALFLLAGPRVARGVDLGRHTVFDVAPTALALLGLPVARDLDGRVLTEALAPEAQAALAIAYVDSFPPPAVAKMAETKLHDDTMENLRALGYVE